MTVRPAQDQRAALQRLAPAVRHATGGESLPQLADGCTLLDVMTGDRPTGAVAVQLIGAEAWINAAADSGHNMPAAVQAVETWARQQGAQRLAFSTKRPGMVRRMLAAGYGIQRADMAKELTT